MGDNPYLAALETIPAGSTRSFAELARAAGRPAGARAAGRAVAGVPADDPRPWHRVVAADGALAPDPARAAAQLARLRAEGARPRADESCAAWAERVGARWIGAWPRRRLCAASAASDALDPARCEPFASEEAARLRGFGGGGRAQGRSRGRARRAQSRVVQPLLPWPGPEALEAALDAVDWGAVREELCLAGASVVPGLVDAQLCAAYAARAGDDALFERSVEMAPRDYGIGRYRTFAEPLPGPARALRARLYRELAPLAREQARPTPARCGALDLPADLPADLEAFHALCRERGQRRGACLLFAYPRGGVNHPHRDVVGPVAFPYQAVVVLSRRGAEFEGGDFLLHERAAGGRATRPYPLDQGDVCVFATRGFWRAGRGGRRWVEVEHGLSTVTAGQRAALGLALHLAE